MRFPLKNKSQPKIQSSFAKIPLSLLEIKTHSTISITEPWNLKIISNIVLATLQKLQIGPQNPFRHIFATATPIWAILASKFSEYFTLSFYAFI
jgi:hypothetical protein